MVLIDVLGLLLLYVKFDGLLIFVEILVKRIESMI